MNTTTENRRYHEFETTALPHRDELLRAAHSRYRRDEAHDLVQEVYLQAWKSFDRFRLGTNCRAWLHKILFHVALHHHQHRIRQNQFRQSCAESQALLTNESDIETKLQDEQFLQVLNRLPPCFAEVIWLADVHEFSYREISELLNIPIGTVMSRLNRGRNRLRRLLANIGQ